MNVARIIFLSIIISTSIISASNASTVTYQISGVGSGRLNDVVFRNTIFKISLIGESDSIHGDVLNLNSAEVKWDGAESATILEQTHLGINRDYPLGPAVFFSRTPSNYDLFDFVLPQSTTFSFLVPYDAEIGTRVFALHQFQFVPTSRGDLSFYASSDVVFSATGPSFSVPETGIWALLVFGFGLVGLALREQRRRFPVGGYVHPADC